MLVGMSKSADNAPRPIDPMTALSLPDGIELGPTTPSGQVRTNQLLFSVLADHEARLDRIEAEMRRRGHQL